MTESFPRKFWRVIYPALLLIVIYLAVYLAAILVYDGFFALKYENVDVFMNAGAAEYVSAAALIFGAVFGAIAYKKEYMIPSDFLYKNPGYFFISFGTGALAGHGVSILCSFIALTGIFGTYTLTENMLAGAGLIIAVIKAVLLVPFTEELVFRGLVFNRTERYAGFWGAALISSVLFGIYHMNLLQGIYGFICGMILCLIYRYAGNLWACILFHAGANLVSLILEVAGVNYPAIWIYAVVMAACLGGCAAIIFLFRSKTER